MCCVRHWVSMPSRDELLLGFSNLQTSVDGYVTITAIPNFVDIRIDTCMFLVDMDAYACHSGGLPGHRHK